MRRAAATTGLLVVLLFAVAGPAQAADPGTTERLNYNDAGDNFPYIVYTPSTYRAGQHLPLLVMVHGCQTTADQQMRTNQYNQLAERDGFVVLYPDIDALGYAQPGPLNKCWRFILPNSWTRDSGDAGVIAGMTRRVMAHRSTDPERTYVAGISAGGFMTSILIAAYPDLYAAAGIMSAGPYESGLACMIQPVTQDVFSPELAGTLTHAEMGARARVMPVIQIHGDNDHGIPPKCGENALLSVLRADNLTISGKQTAPLKLTPAGSTDGQVPNGRKYTVQTWRDRAGCEIAERWIVHGMDHFWSGGSKDPPLHYFTDPTGPSGAEASWNFFKRFRKSDTSMPCAEAPVTKAAPRCAARHLTIMIPLTRGKRVRAVRVSVDGSRAHVTRRGRRVRLVVRPGKRARKIVVRARLSNGRLVTVRRKVAACR
jgi:poly(hydroxyalkanoate) depolymerase family esterase